MLLFSFIINFKSGFEFFTTIYYRFYVVVKVYNCFIYSPCPYTQPTKQQTERGQETECYYGRQVVVLCAICVILVFYRLKRKDCPFSTNFLLCCWSDTVTTNAPHHSTANTVPDGMEAFIVFYKVSMSSCRPSFHCISNYK